MNTKSSELLEVPKLPIRSVCRRELQKEMVFKEDGSQPFKVKVLDASEAARDALQRQANFYHGGCIDEYLISRLDAALYIVEQDQPGSGSMYEINNPRLARSPEIALRLAVIEASDEAEAEIRRQASIYGLDVESYLSELFLDWLSFDEALCIVDPISGIAYRGASDDPPISNLLPTASAMEAASI